MNFIAFDLETTGTLAGVDRIVEIGFVRFVNSKPHDRFACLVDPEMPIPQAASKVNGITDDMVRGKAKIEELLEPLSEWCSSDMLVAHNANFDYQFLLADYKKYEVPTPRGTVFDTLPLSRKVYPGLMSYRLAAVAKHLDIETGTLHRADEDAEYCGHVFTKILQRIYPDGTPDWQDLIRFSGRAELKFPVIEKQLKQLDLFS